MQVKKKKLNKGMYVNEYAFTKKKQNTENNSKVEFMEVQKEILNLIMVAMD